MALKRLLDATLSSSTSSSSSSSSASTTTDSSSSPLNIFLQQLQAWVTDDSDSGSNSNQFPQSKLFSSQELNRPGFQLAQQGAKAKYPVVIIHGFVTSGLELWSTPHDCAKPYFRQRLWTAVASVQQLLTDRDCWRQHMKLDPSTGQDYRNEIKLRPAAGFGAIDYFLANYWVFGKLIQNLADVGYTPSNMAVEPYDWRLAYALLEERDGYFTQLQHRIQVLHETTGEKVVITSHSMGVLVVHYFLTWVTEQQHSGGHTNWVDEHVQAYINLAGTHLGVPKAVTALLSGEMSDTVMVFNPLANAVEHYFGRALRADLWQTWGSLWSMFPKGGNRLWGSAVDLENCGTTGTGTGPGTGGETGGGESSKFNVSSKSPPSKNRDNSSDDDTKNDNADDADDMDSDKKKSEQEQEQRKLNRWNDPFCAATVLDEVWENDDMDDNDDDDEEIDFDHDDPLDRFFGSVAGFSPFLAIADPSTLEAIANYDDLLWLQSNSSSTSSATATSDDHSNSSSVNNNENDIGTKKNVADIKACQALLGNDSVDNDGGGGGPKVTTPIVGHHEGGSKATTDDDNETNEATTTTSGDNYCPAPWSRLPDFVLEDRDLSVTAVMKYLQTRGLKQGLRNAELFSLYNEKQEQDDGVHVLDHDDKKKQQQQQQQKDKKKTKKDKQDERQKAWHDATQTPLPNAPNLKIYCLYGINKPTERAYYYKLHPLLVDDSTDNDPDGDPWFILDTDINIPEQNVHYGIKYSNGDGSVPLLSLGYVCVDAWTRPNGARRGPNLNPGQAAVYTREYPHLPESTLEDPFRSGPKSGDHVDFLGNVDMTTDLLRIVTDFEASTTVNQNQIHSNIVEISQQVHDKYFDPKKKPSWHGQKPKQPQTMRMKKRGGGGGANPRMTTNSKDETDRRKRRQRRRRRYHKGNNYNNDRQSNSKKNLLRRISSFFFSGSRQRNQNNPL
ncbi:hypothetical protein ACA910_011543 [Epithemia clementina (nom. ined.)]